MRPLGRRYVTNETNASHTFDYVWQHQGDRFLNNRPKGITDKHAHLLLSHTLQGSLLHSLAKFKRHSL